MRRANGFTLIELLVAMVAGSLLLSLLSWVVATMGRETASATSRGPRPELYTARPILTSLIEAARNDVHHPVTVTPSHIVLTTSPPMAMGAAGIVELELTAEGPHGKRRLRGVIVPKEPNGSSEKRTFLFRGEWDDIVFSTIENASASEPEDSSTSAIRISFQKDKMRDEIIALPRINAPENCVFDAISMTCRE